VKYMLSVLILGLSVAMAQTSSVKLVKFQPVLELVNTVNLLSQMDAKPATMFSKTQAAKLLEVLPPLLTDTNLEPSEAQIALQKLDGITNAVQRQTLLEKREEQKKLYQKRRTQMTRVSEGGPNVLGLYAFVVPGGSLIVQSLQKGEDFNPFQKGPNAEMLRIWIALLEKR
jgi:hypothetical protein